MSLEDVSFEQRDELAALMKELADNPATRKEVLRLTKKVRPNLPIPEIELEDYTEKKISSAEERVMQLEAKLKEKDAVDELNKRRQAIVKKGLASEDQIDAIEKIMLENGITNHETAAEYWNWMNQAAAPTPTGYNPNPLKGFDLSKFWKDPKMAARNSAAEALAELRKNNRPIGI